MAAGLRAYVTAPIGRQARGRRDQISRHASAKTTQLRGAALGPGQAACATVPHAPQIQTCSQRMAACSPAYPHASCGRLRIECKHILRFGAETQQVLRRGGV